MGQPWLFMDPPYGLCEDYRPAIRSYFPRGVVGRVAMLIGRARGLSWPA